MPFALLVIAILLVVTGARGTYPQLKTLLIQDFTGQHNFLNWIVALGAVGLLGYVPDLQKFSRAMLALIIICLFLSEKGFFTKFQQAIASAGASATS